MSYFRILFPVQMIIIGIAAVNRFVQVFEKQDSTVYTSVFVSSLVLYIVAIIVLLLMSAIISIVRFYQGMYTNEGYLSHTLPVTPTQHITAKLITSTLFYLGSLLAVFVSFIVITLGEVNIELFKALFYLTGKFFSEYGIQALLYIIEALLALIVLRVATFLLYYFCISVGQLVSRKKVLLAFGVYFGIYSITQILGTILIVVFTMNYEWLESITEWLSDNPTLAMHLYFGWMIISQAVVGTLYFVFTRLIMSKKLNLT